MRPSLPLPLSFSLFLPVDSAILRLEFSEGLLERASLEKWECAKEPLEKKLLTFVFVKGKWNMRGKLRGDTISEW